MLALLFVLQLLPTQVLAAGVSAAGEWVRQTGEALSAQAPVRGPQVLPDDEGGGDPEPVPCPGHMYCDAGCEGPENCQCDDSCLCKASFTTCVTPGVCGGEGDCLCGTAGAEYCICPDNCQCRFPDFNAHTTTTLGDAAVPALDLPTGRQVTVDVSVNLSSTGASFSDVLFKTYIESTVTVLPVNMDGSFELVGDIEHNVEMGGKYYTVVTTTTPLESSAAGVFSLDVVFPAGVTPNGTSADIFAVVEGKVNDGTAEKAFGREQMDTMDGAVLTGTATETNWALTLTNVELDYKDEDQQHVFRQKVALARQPQGTEGVYYLKESGDTQNTELVLTLPGNVNGDDTKLLRITDASGKAITGYTVNGNTVTIPAGKLPFDQGSFTDGASSAEKAELYFVFELTDSFLEGRNRVPVGDGTINVYEGANTVAHYDYVTTQKEDDDEKTAGVAIFDYTPGGGAGSIGKWPEKLYVEGKTFYGDDAEATPINYHISYVNRANTPVKNFALRDSLAELLLQNVKNGTVNNVEMSASTGDAYVPLKSVMFYSVTLTEITKGRIVDAAGNPVADPKVWLVFYKNGVDSGRNLLTLGTEVRITDTDVDEVCVEVEDILNPLFSMRVDVKLIGNTALAGAAPGNKENRDKIQFITNKAGFSSTSTKLPEETIVGHDTGTVHVYPYDDEIEFERVWGLGAFINKDVDNGLQNAAATDVQEVFQKNDFYYRLKLTPKEGNHFVYEPVFLMELPPEVELFDEGNIASNVSIYGTESFQFTARVIPHPDPTASGRLLVITAAEKQPMNPAGPNYIAVHCRVSANAPYGATVTSRSYFGVRDIRTPLDDAAYAGLIVENGSKLCDEAGTDLLVKSNVVTLRVPGSGKLEGELSVQTELSRENGKWYKHPEEAQALPGGLLTYKFTVRNGGTLDAENIVLYNVFSTAGDHFIVGGSARRSEWQPYLVGPVQLPPGLEDKATVYYSESDEHRVFPNGVYSGVDDWVTKPYSYTSVKAIKIVFNNTYVLKGKENNGGTGENIDITVPMYAPNDYQVKTGENANNSAISSLATQFNFVGKGQTMALEPLRVIVDLDTCLTGTITGVVWGDGYASVDDGVTAKNGTKNALNTEVSGDDPAKEYVEPKIEVQLYKKDESNNYNYLYSTLTDDAGRYTFTNLRDGKYQLRVILPDGYEAVTAQNQNKFFSYEANGGSGSYVYTQDNEVAGKTLIKNVDAAIYPTPGTIGGMVWRSISGEAERAANTTQNDIALSGVTVTLYRVISGADRVLVDTATTLDGVGTYQFTAVPAGRYVVVFTPLTNYTLAKRAEGPDDDDKGAPTLAGKSQAAVKAEKGEELGQSYEVWLKPGADQAEVNCGLTPAASTIKGHVFHDKNGSMAKDTGDVNLKGIEVWLTKTGGLLSGESGTAVKGTTNDQGFYSFTGLSPGTYKVSYSDTAETPYYVTRHGTTQVTEAKPRVAAHDFESIAVDPRNDLEKTGYDLGLCKKLTISGKVYNDKNSNKAYNTGTDAPFTVAGIVVQRAAGSGGDGTAYLKDDVATVAADGSYSVQVWPGSYTVSFPVGAGEYSDGSSTVDAVNGTDYNDYLVLTAEATGNRAFVRAGREYTLTGLTADAANVDLALVRPRSLAGVVWHDKNGDGSNASPDVYFSDQCDLQLAVATGGEAVPGDGKSKSAAGTGAFKYSGLYPGTYTVTISKSGYTVTNYDPVPATSTDDYLSKAGVWQITIPAADTGTDITSLDFGLAQPVSFAGKVWQDREPMSPGNGWDYAFNGVYDAAEDAAYNLAGIAELYRLVEGTYVKWNNGFAVAGTGTGQKAGSSGGEYKFENLIPGTYKVVLTPAASYYVTGPATTQAALPSGGNATFSGSDAAGIWENIVLFSGEDMAVSSTAGLNLSVGQYVVISGVIYHDLNGDGVKNGPGDNPAGTEGPYVAPSPDPQPAVQLQRLGSGGYASLGSAQPTKAADGSYSFKVKPGKYRVVFGQGSWRVTNPQVDVDRGLALSVDTNQPANSTAIWQNLDYTAAVTAETPSLTGRDYMVSLYAKIEGKAWKDLNASGAKDSGETAYGKITLTLGSDITTGDALYAWWNGYNKKVTMNDATTGEFSFDDLWPGTYYVTASAGTGQDAADIAGHLRTNDSVLPNVTPVAGNQWQWKIVVGSATDNTVEYGLVKPSSFKMDVFRDADNSADRNGTEQSVGSLSLVRTHADGTAIAADSAMKTYSETNKALTPTGSGYTFSNLLPGTYAVTVGGVNTAWMRTVFASALSYNTGQGSVTLSQPDAGNDRVYKLVIADNTGAGLTVTGAAVGFIAPSTLKGCVFTDADQDAAKDSGEANVNGVKAVVKKYVTGTGYVAQTQNSTDGSFELGGLLPGSYQITFENIPATHLVTTANNATASPANDATAVGTFAKGTCTWTVVITSDGKTVTMDTGVIQSVSISGYVWQDLNANKSREAGSESFFVGRKMQLYRTDSGSPVQIGGNTLTGSSGEFAYTNLYPGTYQVKLVKETGDTWYPTNLDTGIVNSKWSIDGISLAAGQSRTNANIGLTQLVGISGRVWEDKTAAGADGIFNTDDVPFGGAVLEVEGTAGAAAGYEKTISTNGSTGQYSLTGLVPGTYTVTLVQDKNGVGFDSYLNVTADKSHTSGSNTAAMPEGANVWTVVIYSGYQQEDCDFALTTRSVLRVQVWDDKDADGSPTPQAEDEGLGDIAVKVYRYDPDNTAVDEGFNIDVTPVGTQKTNALGQWTMSVTVTGKYRVWIDIPQDGSGNNAWAVTTPAGSAAGRAYVDVEVEGMGLEYVQPKFGLAKYLLLSGRVWADPEYDAVYGAQDTAQQNHEVNIYKNDAGTPALTLQTGLDGSYATTAQHQLLPGSYRVVVAPLAQHDVCTSRVGFDRVSRSWELGDLVSGDVRENLDCAFGRGYKVTGELWEDLRATGAWNTEDRAMPQVTLRLRRNAPMAARNAGIVLETTTQSDGSYEFACVMPGDYTVEAAVTTADFSCPLNCTNLQIVFTGCIGDCPDCAYGHKESSFNKKLGQWTLHMKNADIQNVRSGVHVGSEISGMLVQEGSGAPMPGEVVELYKWDDSRQGYELYDSQTTRIGGEYDFGHLLPGNYEVRVSVPAGYGIAASSEGTQQGDYIVLENITFSDMGALVESHVVVARPQKATTGDDYYYGSPSFGTGPQTGDKTSRGPLVALSLLSLAGMAASVGVLHRGQRRHTAEYAHNRQVYRKRQRAKWEARRQSKEDKADE